MGADGTIALSGNTSPVGSPSYLATWTVASPTQGHTISNQPVIVGAINTFSIYMRYVNHQWARVILYSTSATGNQARVWVDLQNKVLGTVSGSSATNISATITDVGNGWVRVTLSALVTWSSSTDAALSINTAVSDNNTTRVGNGAAIESANALFEPYSVSSPQTWRSEFATTGSAWYGPRFDYNPQNNAARGVLVEESRTNLNPNTLTVSVTGGSSADGGTFFGTTVKRVTFDGISNPHFAFYGTLASAPAASTVHTASVYAKSISGTGLIQLSISTGFAAAVTDYVNFDIVNGTVVGVGATVAASSIVNCGNGVFRLMMAFTSGGAPAVGTACLLAAITSASDTRIPTNTSTDVIEMFGGQLEVGNGLTSLIPTYGTAATRASDILATTSISWLDQTKGTFYAAVTTTSSPVAARRVLSINDGTANNSYSILRSTSGAAQVRTAVAGVVNFSPNTANAYTDLSISKVATVLNSPTKKIVVNGGTVATASVAFNTSGYTTFNVGAEGAGGSQLNGWISEIRYYPDNSASNAQLQTLTT